MLRFLVIPVSNSIHELTHYEFSQVLLLLHLTDIKHQTQASELAISIWLVRADDEQIKSLLSTTVSSHNHLEKVPKNWDIVPAINHLLKVRQMYITITVKWMPPI